MATLAAARRAVQWLTGWLGSWINTILPWRCLACGVITQPPVKQPSAKTVLAKTPALRAATTLGRPLGSTLHGGVCATCWPKLRWLGPSVCVVCGQPFAQAMPAESSCAACLSTRPNFRQARSALLYDDVSKPMILRFKHADATHMTPTFAAWMHRAGQSLLAEADVLIPVPLHWRRLWFRQYNQAALLAMALSRTSGLACDVHNLQRRRATSVQGGLHRAQRHRNVKGAFCVANPGRLQGQRVLLIDDVLTTGATVQACAQALLAAGACWVDVLTLARVVHGDFRGGSDDPRDSDTNDQS